MADFIFNVAKGRAVELVHRVDQSDPTNAVLVWVAINTSADDSVLEDLDTLAAVLANGDTAELGNTGYARQVLDDTDVAAISTFLDDANDRYDVDLPDVDFGAITDDDVDITDLLLCYDPDSTGGADSAIIPIAQYDFPVEIDGSDVVAEVNASGAFRAS